MGRHLVLTVHGVGEQRPGETVDAVIGAATTQFKDGPQTQDNVPVEVHRDLIELAETYFDGTPRRAQLFPVHLRRVRRAGTDSSQHDAVFAEVFWADKSPAPKGVLWTMIDLLRVILGLGYVAMDNAENTRTLPAIGVVHAFAWVFYGIIAPLNALMFIGAAALLLDLSAIKIGQDIHAGMLLALVWGATSGLGVWLSKAVAQTYLVRIFGRGLAVIAALLAVLAVFSDPLWDSYSMMAGLNAHLDHIQGGLQLGWIAAVALAGLAYVSALGFKRPDPALRVSHDNTLYPAVCSAMVMLWMVVSAALWLLFQQMVGGISKLESGPSLLDGLLASHLPKVLQSLGLSVAFLGGLILVAAVLIALRSTRRQTIDTQGDWIRRIILNKALRVVFGLFMLAVVVMVFSTLGETLGLPVTGILAFEASGPLGTAVLGGVLALGLFIYNVPGVVAGGLGIGRDVVTFAVMRASMWREPDARVRAKNYPLRLEINARFRRVLQYTLPAYTPDRLTIIAHSLGTVIATQMLQLDSVRKLIDTHGVKQITLVSMGSPVTHLYRHYFPEHFAVDPVKFPPETTWVNIHRADDFVGMTIDDLPGDQITNLRVDAAGHTGYFTDHQVWRHLYGPYIGFKLFRDG